MSERPCLSHRAQAVGPTSATSRPLHRGMSVPICLLPTLVPPPTSTGTFVCAKKGLGRCHHRLLRLHVAWVMSCRTRAITGSRVDPTRALSRSRRHRLPRLLHTQPLRFPLLWKRRTSPHARNRQRNRESFPMHINSVKPRTSGPSHRHDSIRFRCH